MTEEINIPRPDIQQVFIWLYFRRQGNSLGNAVQGENTKIQENSVGCRLIYRNRNRKSLREI
jgi:hypothetical protein